MIKKNKNSTVGYSNRCIPDGRYDDYDNNKLINRLRAKSENKLFNSNKIVRVKFPKIVNIYRSQESIFQDNVDQKLESLSLLKPQIKEQLKSKNRSMVGQRDYLLYKQLGKYKLRNPFCESIKIKEEMNYYLK